MTHVNNAKGAEVEEEERELSAVIVAPAAGSSSAYRFLDAAESSSSGSGSASRVDAVDSVNTAATTTTTTTTAANCLEECHFAACQTKATSSSSINSNWHEDFCITDDELEYEDELLFSSSSAGASTAAATPALECALLGFGIGGGGEREQQNEQLLMEGIFVMLITQRDLVTLARERFIDS